jgi:valyl-tRNA synthetase
VAREDPSQCAHCGSDKITQETDVLDTWFSSGLLPVSVFGWPNITAENRADFDAFYPTNLLVTGFDILFFWVARMIMLGCWFAGDVEFNEQDGSLRPRTLAESVPFREVYIHALVRDANREKMSKTKGNVVDPIEIVKQYGTDAVRFTLASMASPGTDIAFNIARTEGYRAFANKIWNAARFIFMNVDRAAESADNSSAASSLETLLYVFQTSLRLLSPFMPFLTEEIWHALYEDESPRKSIALTSYPTSDQLDWLSEVTSASAETSMDHLKLAITSIRARRKDLGIDDKLLVKAKVASSKSGVLKKNKDILLKLARLEDVEIILFSDRDEDARYANLPWQTFGDIDVLVEYERANRCCRRDARSWLEGNRETGKDHRQRRAPIE